MHENREISSAPSSCSDEGRSAKAINQTTDMHVLEKSDCAVVPVNRSNKEAQASVEAGEGRAQTKENIVPSHKPPTQSGKGLSQGLHGVRRAASVRKQEIVWTGKRGKPTSIVYGGRPMTWRNKQAGALHGTAVTGAQALREGFTHKTCASRRGR